MDESRKAGISARIKLAGGKRRSIGCHGHGLDMEGIREHVRKFNRGGYPKLKSLGSDRKNRLRARLATYVEVYEDDLKSPVDELRVKELHRIERVKPDKQTLNGPIYKFEKVAESLRKKESDE